MKQNKASKKSGTLEDLCPIERQAESGVLFFKDGSVGCIFELQGIDADFFDEPLWNSLYESWRPLLKLSKDESLQICFSKRGDLEGIIEAKFQEMELVKNTFTKKLFLEQLSAILRDLDVDSPNLFSTKIILVFTKKMHRSTPSVERERMAEQKLFDLAQVLEGKGIPTLPIKGPKLWRTLAASASGMAYVAADETPEEWPAVSISAYEVEVNESLFRALTLKQLPEQKSEMGMILALLKLPYPFDLTVRFEGRDPIPLKKTFERKKQVLFAMARGKSSSSTDFEAQYSQIEDVLRRLNDHNDALLDMKLTIGFRAKRENQVLIRRAMAEVVNSQFKLGHLEFEENSLSTFDCFLETIPCFKGKLFHSETLLASNAVHFLPLYESSHGSARPVATFRTRTGELFSINPADEQLANFNWLVSGTSGSGKSFFINSLLAQSMSLNPRIFILDIGGSYNKLTRYLSGDCIGLDVKQGFKMGPFFMERSKDPSEEKRRREHIQMIFVEMLRDENKIPSIEERGYLHEVLEHFFELEELPEHPIKAVQTELLKRFPEQSRKLYLLLERWAYPSFFGDFLDHPLPLKNENDILNFDLKGLSEFDDLSRVVQLIICASLWSRIRTDNSRFTFIVLDEVGFSLLKYEPQFVDELVSTVRKHNAGVILIAQDLEKITSNSAGASILQNTQIKAILQQRGNPKNYAAPLGLNASEISAIQSLDRKKGSFSDIFLRIDDRRAIIRFIPNTLEYYLGTSTPNDNRMLDEALAKFSGNFPNQILQFVESVLK
ncbi:MAG: hypothetical protein JWQ35_2121 [Bacteriovoracaceae bacterium]|nr:hypothetical protein [Bacteriovoracaceae bacterium]